LLESELAIWLTRIGAFTGFLAFLLKLWEFYRDRRPSLWLTYSFSSDPDTGNTLVILNSSKVGTSIWGYSLVAVPNTLLNRLWPRLSRARVEVMHEEVSGGDPVDIEVPPYGQATIRFVGEYHFDWSYSRTTNLYLRLWTTSRRRPISLFVVGPNGMRP
jgi:hypothetical protein